VYNPGIIIKCQECWLFPKTLRSSRFPTNNIMKYYEGPLGSQDTNIKCLQYSAHVETGTNFYGNLDTLAKTHMDQIFDPSRNPIHFLWYSRISMSNLNVLNCQMYQALHTQLESTLYILRAVSNRDPYGRWRHFYILYIWLTFFFCGSELIVCVTFFSFLVLRQ
jgi:hypothetical protein